MFRDTAVRRNPPGSRFAFKQSVWTRLGRGVTINISRRGLRIIDVEGLMQMTERSVLRRQESKDMAKAIKAETDAGTSLQAYAHEVPSDLQPGRHYDIVADEFVTYDGVNVTPELLRMVRTGCW